MAGPREYLYDSRHLRAPRYEAQAEHGRQHSREIWRYVLEQVLERRRFQAFCLNPKAKEKSPNPLQVKASWRRARDSNPRYVFSVHTISSRAPSTNSDNSPQPVYYISFGGGMQVFFAGFQGIILRPRLRRAARSRGSRRAARRARLPWEDPKA